jgi:hypothetical protein
MKPIIWTKHARRNLVDREIDEKEVEKTIKEPERIEASPPDREVFMRRYYDKLLQKEMLLRVVVAESPKAVTIITVYKVSRFERYLRG